jgi:hypothetical protein
MCIFLFLRPPELLWTMKTPGSPTKLKEGYGVMESVRMEQKGMQ